MPNVVLPTIHIGLHKTATTTLQDAFFSRHPEIRYLGRPYLEHGLRDLVESIYEKDGVSLTAQDIEHHPSTGMLRQMAKEAGPLALSEEFLSGDSFADRGLIADRLAQIFGEAKILITIRNQLTMIPSEYLDRIRSRSYVPIDRWVAEGCAHWDRRSFRIYEYDRLADCYIRLFGRENVFVFLFEDFLNDRARFLSDLCAAMGVSAAGALDRMAGAHLNPANSVRLKTYKSLRRLLPAGISLSDLVPAAVNRHFHAFLLGGGKATATLSPGSAQSIRERFAASNGRLASAFGLDLARHGYPVAPFPAGDGRA